MRIPLGVLGGVCGISGSGKSSLVVDTVALALTRPKTNITGVGVVRVEPGAHDAIAGAPARTVIVDQSRAEITSPGMFLRLIDAVRKSFAASEVATESGITIKDLAYGCDACRGKGTLRESMSFLPAVTQTCEACDGTGYRREVASLVERGRTLADIEALTIAELVDEWGDIDTVGRVGGTAMELGLGYLVVRQPGWSLSGGEAQRLKLAKALSRPQRKARSTCSTSRASDCTRRTPPSSPSPSTGSSTPATPCLSSSTTPRCSRRATGSSSSAPERDPMAATSCSRAHRKSWPSPTPQPPRS